MSQFLKSLSFVFHPLLMPMFGVVFYFSKSPLDIPIPLIQGKLTAIFILTIALPILIFFVLKAFKKVNTIYLMSIEERILPLLLNCGILITVILYVVPFNLYAKLYFFFVAILFTNLACLILAILKFKTSIHMIALGGIFMFFIGVGIHYHININGTLALFSVITGAVATSRLHLRAHSVAELVVGMFVGVIPQLVLLNYWL